MGGIYPLSDIRANLIRNSSGNGPINLSWPRASDGKMVGQSANKVYCSVNQTTLDQSINDSLNVSTIKDTGTGQTDISYIADMKRDSYGFTSSKGRTGGQNGGVIAMTSTQIPKASFIKIMTFQEDNTLIDESRANIAINGDLA